MRYLTYYTLIVVGILMTIGTFLKLIGAANIDSDWFWFLAGVGLGVEGIVTLFKQKNSTKSTK